MININCIIWFLKFTKRVMQKNRKSSFELMVHSLWLAKYYNGIVFLKNDTFVLETIP